MDEAVRFCLSVTSEEAHRRRGEKRLLGFWIFRRLGFFTYGAGRCLLGSAQIHLQTQTIHV